MTSVLAAIPVDPPASGQLQNPVINSVVGKLGSNEAAVQVFNKYISVFINIAFGLSGLILLTMLIWGAYRYMTAGGDKEATQAAMKRLTNAIVGIAILFSVYAIISVIGHVFGIDLINLTIPSVGA